MMLQESDSPAEFKEWYDDFEVEHGFFPIPSYKEVYNITEQCHHNIRELIDGRSISKEININSKVPSLIGDISKNESIQYYINLITKTLPQYLTEYKLKKSDLLNPTIGKIKTSKHILTYGRKYLKTRHPSSSQYYISDIEYYVSSLETEKSLYGIKDRDLVVSLHTSLESFIHLGHYGPDSNSCFGQNGGHREDKVSLATVENSFVIVIKLNSRVVARCWGIYVKDRELVVLSNFYIKTISLLEAQQACKQFFEKIFNKKLQVNLNYRLIKHEDIYINGDDISLFVNKLSSESVSLNLVGEVYA